MIKSFILETLLEQLFIKKNKNKNLSLIINFENINIYLNNNFGNKMLHEIVKFDFY